jgi:phospholipid/cholesterol/gamma-HCH transport system substrate-binding protein
VISLRKTGLKVAIFMAVMLLVTGALFAIFGRYRGGAEHTYTAVFEDV